ncbi:MAG: hypothetical protein HY267_03070 [Deltaproteobacteria bacterium]|nr:hypothetical protein [Deltaproteobacteria bacterium]
MRIVVRPADLVKDREVLIETLRRYLTPQSDATRFDWLYRNNPWGVARAWLAFDLDTQEAIGVGSAFPRRFYTPAGPRTGFVLGDFCVSDQYRSLGPALQLQRACLDVVTGETSAFCYDFPSTQMMAVYKRLRIAPIAQMVRLAKPLRIERKVRAVVNAPVLTQAVSTLGNWVLALQDYSLTQRPRSLQIALHNGACGEEFSQLAEATGCHFGVCLQRSAAYMNWRYIANPLGRYELVTARAENVLLAYAVFTLDGEEGMLVDLFFGKDLTVVRFLLDEVVAILRARGAATVQTAAIAPHAWVALLQQKGFRLRESRPIVIYAPPESALPLSEAADGGWLLLYGDRDS